MIRALVATALLAGCWLMAHCIRHPHPVPPRRPLAAFPERLGPWRLVERQRLEERVLRVLGVDDYLLGAYRNGSHRVWVYIGYYAMQGFGDAIHSPKHCYPGGGWTPLVARTVRIELPGYGRVPVNEYLVQRGRARELVYYWYHAPGGVYASEYLGKLLLARDAILYRRSNGALVRISCPDEPGARQRLRAFARLLGPALRGFIP